MFLKSVSKATRIRIVSAVVLIILTITPVQADQTNLYNYSFETSDPTVNSGSGLAVAIHQGTIVSGAGTGQAGFFGTFDGGTGVASDALLTNITADNITLGNFEVEFSVNALAGIANFDRAIGWGSSIANSGFGFQTTNDQLVFLGDGLSNNINTIGTVFDGNWNTLRLVGSTSGADAVFTVFRSLNGGAETQIAKTATLTGGATATFTTFKIGGGFDEDGNFGDNQQRYIASGIDEVRIGRVTPVAEPPQLFHYAFDDTLGSGDPTINSGTSSAVAVETDNALIRPGGISGNFADFEGGDEVQADSVSVDTSAHNIPLGDFEMSFSINAPAGEVEQFDRAIGWGSSIADSGFGFQSVGDQLVLVGDGLSNNINTIGNVFDGNWNTLRLVGSTSGADAVFTVFKSLNGGLETEIGQTATLVGGATETFTTFKIGGGFDEDGNFGDNFLRNIDAGIDEVKLKSLVLPPLLDGDFDVDFDVDGADFLAWQRGFGSIYDSTDLADWQANYGMTSGSLASALSALGAVPEPSSLSLLLFVSTYLLVNRKTTNRSSQVK